MQNSLRRLLDSSQEVFGAWTTLSDPSVIEIMAASGLKYAPIDLEHSVIGLETLQDHLRTAKACDMGTLVRVPASDPKLILRILDAGADGVMVPHVASIEDAARAVDAVRYPPLGHRGIGGATRGANYGAHGLPGIRDLTEQANREVVLAVMIEDRRGVENIDEIASTPGLDMVQIGPGDLTASYGQVGAVNHPDVGAAIERICLACRQIGRTLGMTVEHQSYALSLSELRRLGCHMLIIGSDTSLLLGALKRRLERLKQEQAI